MPDGPKNPEWTPHIWEGANLFAWLRLLITNRFAVSPRYWWVVAIASVVSFLHTVAWLLQEAFFRHRVSRAQFAGDPLFILGHWRSGTTLLHELLILDPRHCFPTTYQCLVPDHFLLSERLITRTFPFLLPARRPMDNMPAGWDRPQEDEFALCLSGAPSPYTHIGFPNRWPVDFDYLDFRGVPARRIRSWVRSWLRFLRRVQSRYPGRRLVLKSPPHSARLRVIRRVFPGARFIHVVRDPYVVYSSTIRLWNALYFNHALQVPNGRLVEPMVQEAGRRLYTALRRDLAELPTQQFWEVKYEDLIRNPLETIDRIYKHFGLSGFADALPQFQRYLDANKGYTPNQYQITPEVRRTVDEHWGEIVRHYGYDSAPPGPATSRSPASFR